MTLKPIEYLKNTTTLNTQYQITMNKITCFILIILLFTNCKKDDDDITIIESEETLSKYQVDLISYFKDIALGFEFGNADKVTRKWNSNLKVFVRESTNKELVKELILIKDEINELVTDGFRIDIVNDYLQSNYYIFLGKDSKYAEIFPSSANLTDDNWGLFTVYSTNYYFTYGRMYVDTYRPTMDGQKHLLREEFTQSLGLARDSYLYSNSIFQQKWTTVTEYSKIDKDLIRLLYHPKMKVGLNKTTVDSVLREIILENIDAF